MDSIKLARMANTYCHEFCRAVSEGLPREKAHELASAAADKIGIEWDGSHQIQETEVAEMVIGEPAS